jgi:hypothetical protein
MSGAVSLLYRRSSALTVAIAQEGDFAISKMRVVIQAGYLRLSWNDARRILQSVGRDGY